MKGVETVKIDKMQAGREMDKLIGEKLFGYWIDHYDKDYVGENYYMLMDGAGDSIVSGWDDGKRESEEEAWNDCPKFSTDILAAWEVMERITEKHWKFKLRRLPGKDYMAYFQNLLRFPIECESAPSGTAPLAICRAALKVVLGSDET